MEVRINNEWGTVCDTGFDDKAGSVVCRILGYGTVKKVQGRAGYGRGIGAIHLTNLRYVYSVHTLCVLINVTSGTLHSLKPCFCTIFTIFTDTAVTSLHSAKSIIISYRQLLLSQLGGL